MRRLTMRHPNFEPTLLAPILALAGLVLIAIPLVIGRGFEWVWRKVYG